MEYRKWLIGNLLKVEDLQSEHPKSENIQNPIARSNKIPAKMVDVLTKFEFEFMVLHAFLIYLCDICSCSTLSIVSSKRPFLNTSSFV